MNFVTAEKDMYDSLIGFYLCCTDMAADEPADETVNRIVAGAAQNDTAMQAIAQRDGLTPQVERMQRGAEVPPNVA